jgi:Flp pilus assembly protein TadD
MLEQAAKALPEESQIPVIRATVLELAGKTDDARHLLNEAQRHWPEVASVWVAQGMIAAAHGQTDAALRFLDTAVTLGAHSAETYYALAVCSFQVGPDRHGAAAAAIAQALKLNPGDPRFQALAARIAVQKDSAGSTADAIDPAKLFLLSPPQDW